MSSEQRECSPVWNEREPREWGAVEWGPGAATQGPLCEVILRRASDGLSVVLAQLPLCCVTLGKSFHFCALDSSVQGNHNGCLLELLLELKDLLSVECLA